MTWLLLAASLAAPVFAQRPLVVISVDGLDHRYLRDAAKLGLKAPNMLRLAGEGQMADGVVGVLSTVTWPSHTTLITGKRPDEHGIRGNRRPREEGGDYYWSASLLKSRTLWHAARDAGLRTAAITWPVTVDAAIDLNLPEAFSKREGGWMDLASIRAKATPGLVEKIIAFDRSFDQEWMDDRTRALATVYFLKREKVDLILLHFVDHDAVAHEYGPFTPEALRELERTDRYIGQIIAAAPKSATICLTADHGFERIDRMINAGALPGERRVVGGVLFAMDDAAVKAARETAGIGRSVPASEVERFAPFMKGYAAAFEPEPHHQFAYTLEGNELYLPPREKGNHGQWPLRPGYRSVFALWRRGQKPERLREMDMLEIAPRLAEVLGVRLN
jgi:predicted AlkP superfamily pyrophosphatase or phosphodiesterase